MFLLCWGKLVKMLLSAEKGHIFWLIDIQEIVKNVIDIYLKIAENFTDY